MGMVTNWLLERAENGRRQEVREWLQDRLGRPVSEREIDANWDEFELAEAYNWSMDKDD